MVDIEKMSDSFVKRIESTDDFLPYARIENETSSIFNNYYVLGLAHRNCRLSFATKNRRFFYRSVKFQTDIVREHDT